MNKDFIDLFSGLFTTGKLEVREITPRHQQTGIPKDDVNKVWLHNKKQITEYKPPKDKECFIGLYNRDRKTFTGRMADTIKTGCLWLDFDIKGNSEIKNIRDNIHLKKIKMNLSFAGLPEPSLIIFSGHGYHVYYKLKKTTDKDISTVLRNICPLVNADVKATDIARIMRIPTSYNNKQEYGTPRLVEVIESTKNTYKLDIFQEIANIKELKVYSKNDDDQEVKSYTELNNFKEKIKMQCLKSMLEGVKKGQRNFALGRITSKLKYLDYIYSKAEEIILQWNDFNEPSYTENKLLKDFKRYWVEDYNLLGCTIKINDTDDKATIQEKGYKQSILSQYCDKSKCNRMSGLKGMGEFRNGEIDFISLPNRIFNHKAIYNNLSSYSLAIFGVLKFNPEGLNINQLNGKITSDVTGNKLMGRNTRIKAIKELLKFNLILKIKGNRKQGIKDFYKTNESLKYSMGYTEINYQVVKRFIDGAFTKSEFKLYALLKSYAYNKPETYPSQETLSTNLGVSQGRVSQIIRELEKKEVIKIKVRISETGRENYIYQL